jgi:uncharacterized protein (DUF433 family)
MLVKTIPTALSQDQEVMHGSLVFAGTRVQAKTLIDYLVAGDTLNDFLEDFPSVTEEQAKALLQEYRAELAAFDPS